MRRSDGAFRWALAGGAPRLDEDGEFQGFSGFVIDFHDRVAAERELGAVSVDVSERNRGLDALRASEARFRTLFETSRDGIVTTDMDGYIIEANPAYQQMLGYTLEELKRLTYLELTPPAWHEMEAAIVQHQIVPLGESVEYEKEYIRKDGGVFPISLRTWTITDDEGRVVAMRAFVRDITERKLAEQRLRASEARLKAVLDSVPDPIFLKDRDSRLLLGNPALFATVGRPEADCLGKTEAEFFPDAADGAAVVANDREILETGRTIKVEEALRTAAGPRHFLTHKAPFRDADGVVIGVIGVARDVTERKRAEESLRRSEERFRALLLASSDVVYRMSRDWAEMRHLVGRSFIADTLEPSRTWLQKYIHPDDQAHVMSVISQAISTKGVFELEHRVLRSDGDIGWTHSRAIPILDEAGEIAEWFGMARDITDRKEAEEALLKSQQQLSLALEAGQLGFWDWDVPSGRVQFGGRWASMLGYEPGEIAPHVHSWETLVHPEEKEAVEATLRGHLEGSTEFYECEHRLRHRDGSWRWILDRGQVVERDVDGQPLRCVGTHTDVTARHEAEDALKEADRRKDEFLATLAHELRNPLAPIHNAVHVLKRKSDVADADARLLDMIQRQTDHLVQLVDDLLEISRISRGKISLKRTTVDLAEVVRNALESCQPIIDKKRHQVIMRAEHAPIWVFGDPVRLTQIASNLVNNAAKYTAPGGTIEIEASRDGDRGAVSVRDTGVGIEAEMLPHIFDLFVQSRGSAEASEGGLGIGLALAHKLIDLHGGAIEAHSDGPGRGSAFVVRLPLAAAPAADAASFVAAPGEGAASPRALVIDDDRDVADSFALLLECLGVSARVAYNGPAGVRTLETFSPDVVFVDLGMPGVDGYETARALQEHPQRSRFGLVALTGWGQEEDRRRTREAGFDLHLTKPASISAVKDLLRRDRSVEPCASEQGR